MISKDADYFLDVQTQTGWGRTLYGFAKWCDPKPGTKVLDVGCGPGLLPAIFSRFGCQAVGVDIDVEMFKPAPLHPTMVIADAMRLPFTPQSFDLISATNLLFLIPQPVTVLIEMKRLLCARGKLALLNPSEHLNTQSAIAFAREEGLVGLAKKTLFNWARRAEENHRWTEGETRELFAEAGLTCMECVVKVGPGFGRYAWGRA